MDCKLKTSKDFVNICIFRLTVIIIYPMKIQVPKNYDQWPYMYIATGVDKGGFVR